MDENIQLLFDRLNEGLLLISSVGSVLYANPAAQEIMPTVSGEMLSTEWLLSQISAVQRGYLKLPLTFDVDLQREDASVDHVQVTLLASPARSNFIALIKNVSAEQQYANELDNFSEMLHCELRAPLQKFLGAVAGMLAKFEHFAEENWTLRNAVAIVSRRSDSLLDRLQKISLLAAASKLTPMRDAKRIPLPALVGDAVLTVQTAFAERGIRVSYCGLENSLPIIYGSRVFLAQALAGYLRYLAERSGRDGNIVITAETLGPRVHLSIINDVGLASVNGSVAKLALPAAEQSRAVETMDLTLAVCKRVVRLNGGSLSFHREGRVIKGIVFVFPIGAPATEDRQLETQQTLRYAQDLNTLMELLPLHFGEDNNNRKQTT